MTTPEEKRGRTIESVWDLLSRVHFDSQRLAYTFVVGKMGDGYFLQVRYVDEDTETGEPERQHGRKWYVSRFSTDSEIVQTAFKAILTSLEHFAREHFLFDGVPVLGPHFDLQFLVEAARARRFDHRTQGDDT